MSEIAFLQTAAPKTSGKPDLNSQGTPVEAENFADGQPNSFGEAYEELKEGDATVLLDAEDVPVEDVTSEIEDDAEAALEAGDVTVELETPDWNPTIVAGWRLNAQSTQDVATHPVAEAKSQDVPRALGSELTPTRPEIGSRSPTQSIANPAPLAAVSGDDAIKSNIALSRAELVKPNSAGRPLGEGAVAKTAEQVAALSGPEGDQIAPVRSRITTSEMVIGGALSNKPVHSYPAAPTTHTSALPPAPELVLETEVRSGAVRPDAQTMSQVQSSAPNTMAQQVLAVGLSQNSGEPARKEPGRPSRETTVQAAPIPSVSSSARHPAPSAVAQTSLTAAASNPAFAVAGQALDSLQPTETGLDGAPLDDIDPALGFGTSASSTGSATASSPAQMTPSAQMGQQIARQLAVSITPLPDGPVEVSLSPEELGKVRMTLSLVDGAIAVSLQAERPETADLLRRHINLLEQEFRDLGYDQSSFSFDRSDSDGEDEKSGAGPTVTHDIDELADATPAADAPRLSGGSGLDLRL